MAVLYAFHPWLPAASDCTILVAAEQAAPANAVLGPVPSTGVVPLAQQRGEAASAAQGPVPYFLAAMAFSALFTSSVPIWFFHLV